MKTLVTPPSGNVVALSEIKDHVNIDSGFTGDDAKLGLYLNAATKYASAMRGEQLLTATWLYTVAHADHVDFRLRGIYGLPDDVHAWVRLPYPPLVSVTWVKYYDATNTLQTLSTSLYRVINGVGQAAYVVFPTDGTTFPTLAKREDAIQIQFVSGYGASTDVPENIRMAIKMLAADWYIHREASGPGQLGKIPYGVDNLLSLVGTGRVF